MVLLINVIPWGILVCGAYALYKTRNPLVILATVAAIFIYKKAQPSYLPKGDIQRASVPEMVYKSSDIEDRNRKPDTTEDRQARMNESIKNGLPFKE